jgi:hypothetical protein
MLTLFISHKFTAALKAKSILYYTFTVSNIFGHCKFGCLANFRGKKKLNLRACDVLLQLIFISTNLVKC